MTRKKQSLLDMERKTHGAGRSSLTRLEDQIAAVAGRKRAAPSGTLEKLEDDLLGRPRGRATVKAQSYDAGAPIALRYRQAHYTLVPETPAQPAWGEDQAFADAVPYTVEPFQEQPAAPESAPPLSHPVPAAIAQTPASEETAPQTSEEAPPPPPQTVPEAESTSLHPALGKDVENFEADIRAILAQGAADEPVPAAVRPPDDAPSGAAPGEDAHAIFDQMGRNMQYANTFNLGTIDLNRRFDAFERELDQQASTTPAKPVAALKPSAELDDMDVLADLVEIGEKAPAKKLEMEQDSEKADPRATLTGSADQGSQKAPGLQTEAEQPAEQAPTPARLAAPEEVTTDAAPTKAAEEKPSLDVQDPAAEFEASRQGTFDTNQ